MKIHFKFSAFLFPPLLLGMSADIHAELYFDPAMIEGQKQVADLSRFNREEIQNEGVYQVDIYVNGNLITSKSLRFVAIPDKTSSSVRDHTGLQACLTRDDLAGFGVMVSAFKQRSDGQCISPGDYIPQAYTAFDFQNMRLDISIPQVAMKNIPRGWSSPELWDEGINAVLLSYRFNGSDNHGRYGNSRNNYLNLESGLNAGAWRLRDNRTWSEYGSNEGVRSQWQHLSTYAERAIIPLRSELTLGDSSTEGDVFSSVSFRGAQLATDDDMYPDTQRGFAPSVKGVATSNARITIQQNGNEIYQTFVAPGAFSINDLYPMSSGGDLNVTVTEADGSVRTFIVPYSSVPVLQREGHLRYSMTAGRYRSNSSSYNSPVFGQSVLQWGLPYGVTLYGGGQLAENYRALALGAGMNMGDWGAVSADVTQANSTLNDNSHHQGQSLRFLYARSLVSTGTTFQLAGYRYSTSGFYTLDETALREMDGWLYDNSIIAADGHPVKRPYTDYYNLSRNRRSQIQANITQELGTLGSLWMNAALQTYWGHSGDTRSLQVGFSGSAWNVSYNLVYGYSRWLEKTEADNTFSLSLSVPLDTLMPSHSVQATMNSSRSSDGSVSHQVGLSGTALEGNNLGWNISQGYGRHNGENGNAGLNYSGTYGNLAAGYSYSQDYRQVNYGAAGGAILHSNGLTLGQPLGVTNILVAAPEAANIPVENGTGIHTDWRGYTVVPYASVFRENRVALDIKSLDETTEIDTPVSRVIPVRGAVVQASFKARKGMRALIKLTSHGAPVPFGSIATAENSSGLVADDGIVYLAGLPPRGIIKAQWGAKPNQQCSAKYETKTVPQPSYLVRMSLTCR